MVTSKASLHLFKRVDAVCVAEPGLRTASHRPHSAPKTSPAQGLHAARHSVSGQVDVEGKSELAGMSDAHSISISGKGCYVCKAGPRDTPAQHPPARGLGSAVSCWATYVGYPCTMHLDYSPVCRMCKLRASLYGQAQHFEGGASPHSKCDPSRTEALGKPACPSPVV
jgi:hypothetical protein